MDDEETECGASAEDFVGVVAFIGFFYVGNYLVLRMFIALVSGCQPDLRFDDADVVRLWSSFVMVERCSMRKRFLVLSSWRCLPPAHTVEENGLRGSISGR